MLKRSTKLFAFYLCEKRAPWTTAVNEQRENHISFSETNQVIAHSIVSHVDIHIVVGPVFVIARTYRRTRSQSMLAVVSLLLRIHARHGLVWSPSGQQSTCAVATSWFAVCLPTTFVSSCLLLMLLLIGRILSILLKMRRPSS